MSDERAKRAARKIHLSRSDEKRLENAPTLAMRRAAAEIIIAAEYAPVIAERDRLKAENEALEDQCRHFRDGHAKIARGVKEALQLTTWPEFTGDFKDEVARLVGEVVSERDRLKAQVERASKLRKAAEAVVRDCERFGDHRSCDHRVAIGHLREALQE